MELGKRLSLSRTAASLALAFGLAGSPALADESDIKSLPDNITPVTQTVPASLATTLSTAQAQSLNDAAAENSPVSQSNSNNGQEDGHLVSTWSVHADPLDPRSVWGGLILMAALLSLYNLKNREQGAAFRVGAAALFTGLFLNPEILSEQHEIPPTDVAIVVDKSTSQTFGDRQTMTETVHKALYEALGEEDRLNVRIIDVGESAEGVQSDGTHVFNRLQAGIADIPRDRLGAVFVLTDGQIHDEPGETAALEGVPMHVLLSGYADDVDRRLVLEAAPRFGEVRETQKIRFRIEDDGARQTSQEPVPVQIRINDAEVKTRHVIPDESVEVDFDLPRAGANTIALEVGPLEGELTDTNNRIVVDVNGLRNDMNVLLVSGRPGKATRTWRRFLKHDPDVFVQSYIIMRTYDKLDHTPLEDLSLIPFPHEVFSKEQIDDFDLIIFDDYQYQQVLPPYYFDNIEDYVEKGGAVLVAVGSDLSSSNSLEKLMPDFLPVESDGGLLEKPYRPVLTADGQKHPVTRGLSVSTPGVTYPAAGADTSAVPSWGRWSLQADTRARRGDVIMSGVDGNPLLTLDRVGEGRIGVLTSDQLWLWERGFEGGGPYEDLMQRMTHWLLKNPALEEEALRLSQQDGKIIVEQQTMDSTAASISITTPSGKTIDITPDQAGPGLWRAAIPADESGLYSAVKNDDSGLTAFYNAGGPAGREFSRTVSTFSRIESFVGESGGTMRRMVNEKGEVADLPDIVLKKPGEMADTDRDEQSLTIRATDDMVLKGVDRYPVPPPWAKAALLIGLIGLAWYKEGGGTFGGIRKRFGDKGDPRMPESPAP